MKTKLMVLLFLALPLLFSSACTSSRSTVKRVGLVSLGAAAGGAAGSLYEEGGTAAVVGGAVLGGALTQLALGDDEESLRAGFQRGYIQGQSDAIKRQYFLRHAKECERPKAEAEGGQFTQYLLPAGTDSNPNQRVLLRVVE